VHDKNIDWPNLKRNYLNSGKIIKVKCKNIILKKQLNRLVCLLGFFIFKTLFSAHKCLLLSRTEFISSTYEKQLKFISP